MAQYNPQRLLLLDRDETLLHEVAVGTLANAETVLLDICDSGRVMELLASTRPEVIFHAAASKHVPILERYPAQAATTNVLGTWWLATAAADHGCRRFVHLSTDKAAQPCSVMGATKRAAEHVVMRGRQAPRPPLRRRPLRERPREPRERRADLPAADTRWWARDGDKP